MFVVHLLKVKNNNNTLFVNDGHYFLTRRLIMVVVHCSTVASMRPTEALASVKFWTNVADHFYFT